VERFRQRDPEHKAAQTRAEMLKERADWFTAHQELMNLSNSIRSIARGDDGR
jgi:hypothetical protein